MIFVLRAKGWKLRVPLQGRGIVSEEQVTSVICVEVDTHAAFLGAEDTLHMVQRSYTLRIIRLRK